MKMLEVSFFDPIAFKGDEYNIYTILTLVNILPKGDWRQERTQALRTAYDTLNEKGKLKPLPDGSNYHWFDVTHGRDKVVGLVDSTHQTVIGALYLSLAAGFTGVWDADMIAVMPGYRGQKLGLKMFGLVLVHEKLTITCGDGVTPLGRKLWSDTPSIPGVEMFAIIPKKAMEKESDAVCEPFQGNKDWCLLAVSKAQDFFVSQHIDIGHKKLKLAARYVG